MPVSNLLYHSSESGGNKRLSPASYSIERQSGSRLLDDAAEFIGYWLRILWISYTPLHLRIEFSLSVVLKLCLADIGSST